MDVATIIVKRASRKILSLAISVSQGRFVALTESQMKQFTAYQESTVIIVNVAITFFSFLFIILSSVYAIKTVFLDHPNCEAETYNKDERTIRGIVRVFVYRDQ